VGFPLTTKAEIFFFSEREQTFRINMTRLLVSSMESME
jgi:hypothetical protein